MDNIFINSKNSKKSDPHRLLLNLVDKIDLKRKDKYIALSNLCITIHGRTWKSDVWTINLKYQLEHGMKNLNYLMDHIRYSILFWIYIKKAWGKDS